MRSIVSKKSKMSVIDLLTIVEIQWIMDLRLKVTTFCGPHSHRSKGYKWLGEMDKLYIRSYK